MQNNAYNYFTGLLVEKGWDYTADFLKDAYTTIELTELVFEMHHLITDLTDDLEFIRDNGNL